MEKIHLVLIEDGDADIGLVKQAVGTLPIVLHVVRDGELAMEFFDRVEHDDGFPCPKALLLDLNLPERNGAEVLERVRQSPKFGRVPVMVVTSSDSQRDRKEMARLGATHYFRKPASYHEFLKLADALKQILQEVLTLRHAAGDGEGEFPEEQR